VTVPGNHAATIGTVAVGPWPATSPTANQAVLTLTSSTIAAGDLVTVTITAAENPPSAADYSLSVLTSADQLPAVSASYTVSGTAPAASGPPPVAGRLSLVALTGTGYDPTGMPLSSSTVCGLVLDEWPEQIPNRVESTALVFNYQEPTARAPQAMLLAVNPTEQQWWLQDGYDLIRTILEETLDLAKVRTVDLASLSNGGQFVPALYLPVNPGGDTITVNLTGSHLEQAASAGPQTAAGR
jgi:hypothetical protein